MGTDDTLEYRTDLWTSGSGAQFVAARLGFRPMRGQVVVREIKDEYATIRGVYRLGGNPREVKIHRGTVLAIGAPMLTAKGAEVPHGFSGGDVVLYSFQHNERAFTYPWSDDKPATWIPQWAVSAVLEEVGGSNPPGGKRLP